MTTLVAGIEVRGVIASVVPPSVIEVLAAALAIVAILGFAVMFVIDIYRIWSAPAGQTPVDNQAFLYVATALAALIGGFVAVSFGVKPPSSGSLITRNVQSLGRLLLVGPVELIGSAYLVIYLALAVAAIVTWVGRPSETTALVKNLALTFVGLLIPIVSAYLQG